MDSLLRIFPQKRRDFWKVTADKAQEVCEIRLRVDRPVIIETSRGDFFLAAPRESKFIPGRGNPRWSTKKSPRLLAGRFFLAAILRYRHCPALRAHNHYLQ
jgi:hypothetical protein